MPPPYSRPPPIGPPNAPTTPVVPQRNSPQKAPELAEAINNFVSTCQLPALLESGESPIPLRPEHFRVDLSPKGLWLEAWDDRRMWSRRILSAGQPSRKRLELEAFRFGNKPIKVTLLDAADTRSNPALEKSFRSAFAERFRLFTNRHYGRWRLEAFHADANLEKSQSPIYPTALYSQSGERILALGAPPRDNGFHPLTFALIALAQSRAKHLVLYLHEHHARPIVQLARRLNEAMLEVNIWLYADDGHETLLDPADTGNLHSALAMRGSRLAGPAWWTNIVDRQPNLDSIEEPDGSFSYRILGYEVARMLPAFGNATQKILWGPKLRSEASPTSEAAIKRYFEQVNERRRHDAPNLLDPLYLANPERWLESSVRKNIQEIDPSFAGEVYGQVIGAWGGERSTADLLARDGTGRLAVLELKATEDIHLPLQAFDYWLRVRQHLASGDFRNQGYWPGLPIAQTPPKLYLIAPALHFHPTTQTILSYLPPECEVQIIGLAANWRHSSAVALRHSLANFQQPPGSSSRM